MQGVIILSCVGMLGACVILLVGLLRLAWINSQGDDGWKTRKRTDVNELQTKLPDATKDIALVCYEKPGVFCHRHLVAD